MNKRIITICAVLCLALASCSKGKTFTFVQISDPQLGFREQSGFQVGAGLLERAVAQINAIAPDFVVVTGDMTNNSRSKEEYEAYMKIMGGLSKDIAVYYAPGNHDIKSTRDTKAMDAYRQKYGEDHFCFTHKGSTFIGINSCYIMDRNEKGENAQKEWLVEQLEGARKSKHIFVFMHCPIVYSDDINQPEGYSNFPMEKRKEYVELFKKYGVDCVFAGHLHDIFDVNVEGLRIFTAGPSGLALGHGYSGLNVVEVTQDGYTTDYRGLE